MFRDLDESKNLPKVILLVIQAGWRETIQSGLLPFVGRDRRSPRFGKITHAPKKGR